MNFMSLGSLICISITLCFNPASAFHFNSGVSINSSDIYGSYRGDIVLGGLFPIHGIPTSFSSHRCGNLNHERGIHRLEAMYYALDKINKDEQLLPNVNLGAETRDTCGQSTYALEGAVQFVMSKLNHRRNGCSSTDGSNNNQQLIGGVVGAASSSVSLEVASLFRLFEMPQVSYASTTAELNDRERYSFFVRTVPSDTYQVRAIVDIILFYKWRSVFVVFSQGSYGENGAEKLQAIAKERGICIVSSTRVNSNTNYDSLVTSYSRNPGTTVVVVFCGTSHVQKLLKAAKKTDRKFTWLGSDFWGSRIKFLSDSQLQTVADNAITLAMKTRQVTEFQEYFRRLNPRSNKRNPWFAEFWEEHFRCSLKVKDGVEECERNLKIDAAYKFDSTVPYVIDAIYALAYALDKVYRDSCPDLNGVCGRMKNISGAILMNALKTVSFTGTLGPVRFDKKGNSFHGYDIMQFRNGAYRKLGTWDGQLNVVKVNYLSRVNSSCSSICGQGEIRVPKKNGPACCYLCQACGKRQYVTVKDQCSTCPYASTPNRTKNGCRPLPVKYLQGSWVIVVTSFAGFGIVVTCAIILVFIYYNDTPIVRASARELSYPLLIGVLLCYCLTYVIVSDATHTLCGVTRFGLGFCFSVCYSALLIKTNRICRIFSQRSVQTRGPRFISPLSQLVLMGFIVLLEAAIAVVLILIERPTLKRVMDNPADTDYLFFVCKIPSYDVAVSLSYNVLLIIICTFYAVKTRNIPTDFNEAKYLGFVMYTTCVIWIASVPVYFGIRTEYGVITICLNIILSATSIVAGVFGPKLYIIIFRPGRNIRTRSTITFRQSDSNDGEICEPGPLPTIYKNSGAFVVSQSSR